jgi:hypothetical protein
MTTERRFPIMTAEFPQSWPRKRLLMWEHLRMQRDDDPEARIRDLERPLADVARASELGTEQHGSGGAYLPPPVQSYGAPYPTAPYPTAPYPGAPFPGVPAKSKSGSGALWLLFAGIAVVLILIAGGVVIWTTSMFKLDSSTRPPVEIPDVSGGGGQVDKAPGGQPAVPGGPIETVPEIEPSVPLGPIPPPGEPLSVSGVGKNETIACNESVVTVSGVNNTVTITGHCVSLTVSGVENVVTVDAADTIGASGFDNEVIYHSGAPQINATGSNVVSQG